MPQSPALRSVADAGARRFSLIPGGIESKSIPSQSIRSEIAPRFRKGKNFNLAVALTLLGSTAIVLLILRCSSPILKVKQKSDAIRRLSETLGKGLCTQGAGSSGTDDQGGFSSASSTAPGGKVRLVGPKNHHPALGCHIFNVSNTPAGFRSPLVERIKCWVLRASVAATDV